MDYEVKLRVRTKACIRRTKWCFFRKPMLQIDFSAIDVVSIALKSFFHGGLKFYSLYGKSVVMVGYNINSCQQLTLWCR